MPATQSNGTIFIRALVMLGFLAVIFYAAVSGNALPDAARKQLEKYLPKALVENKSTTSESANDSAAAKAVDEAPLFNSTPATPLAMRGNTAPQLLGENGAVPRQLAVDGSASMLPMPSAAMANNPPEPVVPVDYQTSAETPQGLGAGGMPNATRNAASLLNSTAANPFSQMQDRLKQWGATYYLLETWGNEQQFYRFYCKMAVGGNANYTHCFESTHADPLQAMSEVLKQVEAWRNGRR